MTSELLLIFFVTILVFGPSKLPMLAEHFAKLLSYLRPLKEQIDELWQSTLAKQTLLENQNRAEKADAIYRNKLSTRELDKTK